jgi:hypothetical protein
LSGECGLWSGALAFHWLIIVKSQQLRLFELLSFHFGDHKAEISPKLDFNFDGNWTVKETTHEGSSEPGAILKS